MTTTVPTPRKPPTFTYFNKRDLITLVNMVAPLAFVSTIGLYFGEFVWHAIAVNLAINFGIIGMAMFGVVLILIRLISAQKDFRIIERFGYEAMQGVYMKNLLEQPWLAHRYVRHYLSHIANTGGTLSTQLEHSAIESELHALQIDYESRMELPQFIVGFMIAMGLLGTFIGLLETLTGISGMLDHMSGSSEDIQKQFMQLVSELRKPLAGMGIAFSASMFGLITSLMLAIMMINLRRFISRVISLARNIMHELTQMAREQTGGSGTGVSLSPSDIDALLTQGEEARSTSAGNHMRQRMFQPIAGGNGGLDPAMAGRFDVMTKKIELLIETIGDTNETTRRLNDLIGFGPRMKELYEKALDELKTLSTKNNEQQRLLQALTDQITQSNEIAIGNGRHLYDIKENFTKISKNSNLIELIAGSIGGQTALLETLIDETRRSQQGLAIINKTIMEK